MPDNDIACSVEIVQDMFVKTLLGVFAVPAGKGKLEKILKKSSNFLPFHQEGQN